MIGGGVIALCRQRELALELVSFFGGIAVETKSNLAARGAPGKGREASSGSTARPVLGALNDAAVPARAEA
jgi:hypothetical protein